MNDTDTNTTNNGKPNNNNKNDGHLNMLSRCLGKEKQNRVYPVGFYPVGPFRWLNKAVRNKGNLALIAAAARCERGVSAVPVPQPRAPTARTGRPRTASRTAAGSARSPSGRAGGCGRRTHANNEGESRGGGGGWGGCIPSPPIGEK